MCVLQNYDIFNSAKLKKIAVSKVFAIKNSPMIYFSHTLFIPRNANGGNSFKNLRIRHC